MAILAKSSNTHIDSFWEAPQVSQSNHIRVQNGKYRFEIQRGQTRKNVYRSELRTKVYRSMANVLTYRIAFDFEIETDQKFDGSAVIWQLWQDGSPSNSIQWDYETNQIFYRISGPKPTYNKVLFVAEKGKPRRITIDIDARQDNNGYTKIWVDGKLVEDFKGRNLYNSVDPNGYPKIGLYDDDSWPSGLQNRVVYFSNIVFADKNTPIEELIGNVVEQPKPEIPEPKPEDPNNEVEELKKQIDILYKENSDLKSKIQQAINILG